MSDRSSSAPAADAPLLSLSVHELRTPTSVVAGYLRMLQSGAAGALSDPQRKMIAEAEKSCARIAELIAELGDIGKFDGGTAELSVAPLDLFKLVHEVACDVHAADERDVHLDLRGEQTGAPIMGDRRRLSHAFSVFFRAVLREQPASTTVVVDRRLAGGGSDPRAVILVARADCVQETYDAPPGPLDEFRGGLGLGLPLARRVVERHAGRVWTPAPPVAGDAAVAARSGVVVSLPIQAVRQE